MFPLIGLAATFLPDLIKLIAGDRAGAVANKVSQAVVAVAGTDDPVKAAQTLQADTVAAATLRQKLAEIALEAQKEQDAASAAERADELTALKASIENTAGARDTLKSLVASHSPIAWASPTISLFVMAGFFGILATLIIDQTLKLDPQTANLINIAIGVLGTAFATVVNFWLGSSSSSRSKDAAALVAQDSAAQQNGQTLQAIRQIQQTHTQQTSAAFETLRQVAASATAGAQAAAQVVTATETAPLAKPDTFARCVGVTLVQEGGYTVDSGGPTNFGITQKTLQAWRGHEVTAEDVQNLSREEAVEIYRANYWNAARCGDMPTGVDLMVFDFGVNAGPRTSVKLLQGALGVTEDGSVGPMTLKALDDADAPGLMKTLARLRLDYYRGLGAEWAASGKGWTRRTNAVLQTALAMAGATGDHMDALALQDTGAG